MDFPMAADEKSPLLLAGTSPACQSPEKSLCFIIHLASCFSLFPPDTTGFILFF
jgi:hypothetical protein